MCKIYKAGPQKQQLDFVPFYLRPCSNCPQWHSHLYLKQCCFPHLYCREIWFYLAVWILCLPTDKKKDKLPKSPSTSTPMGSKVKFSKHSGLALILKLTSKLVSKPKFVNQHVTTGLMTTMPSALHTESSLNQGKMAATSGLNDSLPSNLQSIPLGQQPISISSLSVASGPL